MWGLSWEGRYVKSLIEDPRYSSLPNPTVGVDMALNVRRSEMQLR